MQKKLTITVEESVYEGLHRIVGRGRISGFIEDLVRPHVVLDEIEGGSAPRQNTSARPAKTLRRLSGRMR